MIHNSALVITASSSSGVSQPESSSSHSESDHLFLPIPQEGGGQSGKEIFHLFHQPERSSSKLQTSNGTGCYYQCWWTLCKGNLPLRRWWVPCFFRLWSNLRATIACEYYPNVSAVATSVSSHSTQLINYAKSCVKPAYNYFEDKLFHIQHSSKYALQRLLISSPLQVTLKICVFFHF